MNKWDERFLDLAHTVASWSKDPERKVGCVLVEPGRHQFAMGYNGFPADIKDEPRRLSNNEVKNSMTVHAELNAILNARCNLAGWTAYITATPCVDCCKSLIQAGILTVVCPKPDKNSKWHYSQQFGLNLLIESGSRIVHIPIINETECVSQGLNNNTVTDEAQKSLINQGVICDHEANNLWFKPSTQTMWCKMCNTNTGIPF